MFRIHRILDSTAPANLVLIEQVQNILRAQFSALKEDEILDLPNKLKDALKYRFQSRLLIATNKNDTVLGFALIMHATDIGFCYLDFIAVGEQLTGKGFGGVLYDRVRDEAIEMGARCILMECLPDDPDLSPDPAIRAQNAQRLAFYSRFGAHAITGTLYETSVNPEDTDPPYLVIDPLGQDLPDGKFMQKSVRAILERKYGDMCDSAYVDKVVKSFPISGITVRTPKASAKTSSNKTDTKRSTVALFANEGHTIHHVREQGYVESPVRIRAILKEVKKLDFLAQKPSHKWADQHIQGVHDADYMAFLKRACMSVEKGKSVYPYVFPIRNQDRKPVDTPLLAGYYCIDTFTPLNAEAYKAARTAVDCSLSAAEELVSGTHKVAYALVRPPGHHAERKSFGGFCYFANTAIAAHYLSQYGKVAILDVDYHHGNSQQDIFYTRDDVLTVSLHGHPKFAYPYFTGFKDEMGEGRGYGYNLNIPLPEHLTPDEYLKQVSKALKRIADFKPTYLVIALGLDTAKSDPTGTWTLLANDFAKLGASIGKLKLPTLIVQEGGYRTRTLGINAKHFFYGLYEVHSAPSLQRTKPGVRASRTFETRIRTIVRLSDVSIVRDLVAKTKVFSDEEIEVAGELVAEAALKGAVRSGYSFSFFEEAGEVIGYSCFGRVPLTDSSFDLYWLVVDPEAHKRGIAQRLQAHTEQAISAQGGTQMYAETSSTDKYKSARSFYLKAGFTECARQTDFYRVGDDKVTYVKALD